MKKIFQNEHIRTLALIMLTAVMLLLTCGFWGVLIWAHLCTDMPVWILLFYAAAMLLVYACLIAGLTAVLGKRTRKCRGGN